MTATTIKQQSPQADASQADLVKTLNRQQANALITYLNYKKYHWTTFGPLFRDLHLLFEEQGTEVFATIDELAERSLMIDGAPLADPAQYLPTATVKPSAGPLSVREMVEEAITSHELIISEMHSDADMAAAIGDIGTADLYTRLVQIHQKHRWFLKELLKHGDKLVS